MTSYIREALDLDGIVVRLGYSPDELAVATEELAVATAEAAAVDVTLAGGWALASRKQATVDALTARVAWMTARLDPTLVATADFLPGDVWKVA